MGQSSLYSEMTFPDIQHWAGSDSLTMAEAANIFPPTVLNPIITAPQPFLCLYVYGEIVGGSGNGGGAALQEADRGLLLH